MLEAMPQGRLHKRPSDAGDSSLDSPSSGPKAKMPRLERGHDDFSSVVKSKLQSYTRTGQACDRCKVRKIRCDALPEGCSHCTSQSLECKVTDRVTGRTERRGYTQQLEREKREMLDRIRDLEKLLEDNGVEIKPWHGSGFRNNYASGLGFNGVGNSATDVIASDRWSQVGSEWVKTDQQKSTGYSETGTRNSVFETRPSDSYLGVMPDSALLSSIKGNTLSILGMTIDITEFDAPDIDEPPPGIFPGSPLYNKSVMSFMQSIMNINPPLEHVELPSRHDAFTYVEWFFLVLFPFVPILHKPSFLKLLTRIYDEPNFKPSIPELVIVHMVFAAIYFQYGIRNREEPEKQAQLNELSNKHYHWCLSKFFDLCASQTVAAVQAMAMIGLHTRSFPKPGCSTAIANHALGKAIDMNFHRAMAIPNGGSSLEYELRKRIWWSILGLAVTLNGRLGKPMPLGLQDFDVDFPVAIPDESLGQEGIFDHPVEGRCNYLPGLVGFRTIPLYMEMYSSIYSARRDPSKYTDVVRRLEEGMRSLLENLPDELKLERAKPGSQVFALYMQGLCLEFRLCLRHPSVCLTDDPVLCAENLRVCEETARKLLKVVAALFKVKCLDTTWYQLSVYVAAIFSTLVAHWERRLDTSPPEIATLREEMSLWLSVIGEIGNLLGTGAGLVNKVGAIIERTINEIEHGMNRQDTSASSDHARIKQESTSPFPTSAGVKPQAPKPPPITAGLGASTSQANVASAAGGYYEAVARSTPYPTMAYPSQPIATAAAAAVAAAAAAAAAHQNANAIAVVNSYDLSDETQYLYSTSAPVATASATEATDTIHAVEQADSAQNSFVTFASQATQHADASDWRPQTQAEVQLLAAPGQNCNTWHNWTAAVANSEDRYDTNTLLTLGATNRPGNVTAIAAGMGGMGMSGLTNTHAAQWPLLLFHDGTGAV